MADDVINVFQIDGGYVFKQFFDSGDVFTALQDWYNGEAYRFEVRGDIELDDVEEILDEHGYTVHMVEPDELAAYTVVKDRSESYGDILRDAVAHVQRGDYNIFLMADEAAAEQAAVHGATRITETDLPVPF